MLVTCLLLQPGWAQGFPGDSLYNSFRFFNGPDQLVYDSDGMPLFGPEFVAMLYGGATTDSLQPAIELETLAVMEPVAFNRSPGRLGLDHRGYNVTALALGTEGCGSQSWLQVVAWDTRVAPTYEAAVELDLGGYGASDLFLQTGGSAPHCEPQGLLPQPLVGLESFRLLPVIPEPGTTWLVLLGLPGFVWFRWRHGQKAAGPQAGGFAD